MIQIDPHFRRMGRGARRRRLRVNLLRAAALLAVLAVSAAALWHQAGPALVRHLASGDDDLSMVPVEGGFELAPIVRVDTFTDIAGDPMFIAAPDQENARPGRFLSGPAELAVSRVGAPSPRRLTLIREDLHLRERRLVAALPTTREQFALFQAERTRERLFDGTGATLPGAAPPAPVAEAAPRRSSAVAFMRDPATRPALWQELIIQIAISTDIASLLGNHGFDRADAERLAARITDQLGIAPELPRGTLLALRYRMQGGARQVLQLSLYRDGDYVGSLGMGASGQLVQAAYAWADQPLMGQSATGEAPGEAPQFRLLDVIYSAALRQGVSSELIGEAIALMSRVHDLDALAAEGDRLQLVLANQPGPDGAGAGQVLFIGVTGPSGRKPCYVVPQPQGGHDCHAPGAGAFAGAPARAVMAVPVSGVLARRFSSRGDGDVIWQAAQGSPVMTVAAGRIAAIDPGARGLDLRIEHAGGLISIYRGLEALPAGVAVEGELTAGAIIGHLAAQDDSAALSFQLMRDGVPVDPIPLMTGTSEIRGSGAVEALINRIIQVESAGNPQARNPLSTATGLGQFIESTWLRMMQTYRPDLVAGMDRRQLLDLRLDPDLSRQMVRSLAQENEAFLRARGHQATPGQLYLAHFLGPVGAAQALAVDPARPVAEVMGARVVTANPFLRSYSIADLHAWADRKMSGHAPIPAAPERPVPPEVQRFVALVDTILTASGD